VQARALYLRACEAGHAGACSSAGGLFLAVAPRDVEKGKELMARGCDAEPRTCFNLARLYETGEVPRDPARAVELYRTACEAGHAESCTSLGMRHLDGQGVPRSAPTAAESFRLACAGGDDLGCRNLGALAQREPGAVVDVLGRACDAGAAKDCVSLGMLYVDGPAAIPPDPARAARLYERACDAGASLGCLQLGILHLEGRGVERSRALAAALDQRACDGGDPLGCVLLGRLRERGWEGVPPDREAARVLYGRACEGGNARACDDVNRLEPR
jgi:hypothetical protein